MTEESEKVCKLNKLSLLLIPLLASCGQSPSSLITTVKVNNSPEGSSVAQVIELPVDAQYQGWKLENGESEWVKNDTGKDVLLAAVSVPPGNTRELKLVPDTTEMDSPYIDRAHAELSVRTGGEWEGSDYKADGFSFEEVTSFTSPEQLTDHSYFLRYEGPGWESDKMGYRLYLDWRNAIDVFVKTDESVVLPQVGQDGYDSYHALSSWGGDALKVGKSLGVGALGRQTESGILHFQHVDKTQYALVSNSNLRAEFDVSYTGWALDDEGKDAVDATTRYRIDAFDPTTHIHVELSEPKSNIVTGLVAHKDMSVVAATEGDWGVIGTWGSQSILSEGDTLGLALFYRISQVDGVSQGEFDHLVSFKPLSSLDYKIAAVWPQRDTEVQTAAQFEQYLIEKLNTFNHPIQVVK